nr:MAG TPA: Pyocin activator protein PrtN [Caudoviricetes sp.]
MLKEKIMRERTKKNQPPLGVLMIDVQAVARKLSIGVSTVWKLAKTNPNFPKPFYFNPRNARWKMKDLENYVNQLQHESVAATA